MGLTDDQYLERLKNLNPPTTQPAEPTPTPQIVTEDATIGNEERIRGIPAVGRVSGTMKGTRPGDTLNQHGREIIRHAIERHHYRPTQEDT